MAISTQLSIGYPQTLVQNQVYALPSSRVRVQSQLAVEHSVQESAGFVALTGAETTGAETSAAYLRCTAGACIVTLKRI